MLRSVKNLSDELGVEKFRIYKFIKDNNLKVTHLGSSKIMYFDDREAEKIIRAFTPELAYEDEHGEPLPVVNRRPDSSSESSLPEEASVSESSADTASAQTSAVSQDSSASPATDISVDGFSARDQKDGISTFGAEDQSHTASSDSVSGRRGMSSDTKNADGQGGSFPYDEVLRQLRLELKIKNRQIDDMNSQLTNMTNTLRNANECIKRLAESTRNLTESLRASQAMYLSAVQSISEEQEKTRLLQGQVAEAEAGREAALKEAAESAAAVREAAHLAHSAKETAEKAADIARAAGQAAKAGGSASAEQTSTEPSAHVPDRSGEAVNSSMEKTASSASSTADTGAESPHAQTKAGESPSPQPQNQTRKTTPAKPRRRSFFARFFGF